MAVWRKIHIDEEEWSWVISKNRYNVVIRELNKSGYHTV